MIKARNTNGDIVFGLSDVNIEALKLGRPIVFNAEDVKLPKGLIMIFNGPTEEKMYEMLIDGINLKTKITDEVDHKKIQDQIFYEIWEIIADSMKHEDISYAETQKQIFDKFKIFQK